MKIKIICFGKMDDVHLKNVVGLYSTRIKHYSWIEAIELEEFYQADVKTNQNRNEKLLVDKLAKEKNVYLLDIDSKQVTSNEFSEIIRKNIDFEGAEMCFLIGPSDGFSDSFKKSISKKISFGKITLPHQLCRIVLYEQIFRAFKIINNEKYHK